ncbi:skeletal aspartic acid-rich protein 1-like [Venturia canescens]|uniref:skeletal aspartic acid-rich protein 1-like n=1 Tax=Venturia canescens TaxID=32260 RepID=UPI001C9BC470|nr:skeletal aspartic acid-rich protein 1-like [Venturia canescens]
MLKIMEVSSSTRTTVVAVSVPRQWLSACSRDVLESILRRALRSYIVAENDVSVRIAGIEAQLVEFHFGEYWFVPKNLFDDNDDDNNDNNDNNDNTDKENENDNDDDDVIVLDDSNDNKDKGNEKDNDDDDDVTVLN